MPKKILYQDNARRALERGMEIMVEAVSVTLGPKGRNVVLEKAYGSPQIVNDGVTIAKEIKLEDHIENTGVSLIRFGITGVFLFSFFVVLFTETPPATTTTSPTLP